MSASAIELYATAFLAQCAAMQRPGAPTVDEVGLRGLLSRTDDPRVRLLVTDDQAHDALASLLQEAWAGMIRIFGTAPRCAQLVENVRRWRSETVTAMVCSDLDTVPALALPRELTVRAVQRLANDDSGGVPLEDAVAVAISAAPAIEDPPEVLANLLRSLPSTFRLFAAVDRGGTVRATSGSGVFGQHATVIFVNTDRDWRGRGIGQAMTAHALRAAQQSGARQACLDASASGRSIYSRLGFEAAGMLRRFVRVN